MSTLPAEASERKEASGPLTADGLLRRRACQRPGVTALSDPPNLQALGLGHPRTFSYLEADQAVDDEGRAVAHVERLGDEGAHVFRHRGLTFEADDAAE